MKNQDLYYKLPTIRKARRQLRRKSQKITKEFDISSGFSATFILRDINDANILKTRRWRNRLGRVIVRSSLAK